ncbi:integrase catalytic domain-containing protein [Trichonephila clavipes]|nr:integrase catalytic domain-containing protein [Trichonephila clavipes]
MKKSPIPRLELLGAALGARLAETVHSILRTASKTYFWSNSMVVLSWITKKEPLNTFVGNQVMEIRDLTYIDVWRHVPGEFNPADLVKVSLDLTLRTRINRSHGVWSPRTAKTAAHLFAMDAMRLSIRLWGILFHSSRSALQVSDSSRRPWSRSNVSSEHVPNMLNWIQVRRARWPFHTLYCFSFKHVLHQTSSMWLGIVILENKGISNGSSVRDDIRSKYLVCIPSACQKAIPNDMQVRTSAYADSTPYHPTCSSVL